MLPGLSRIILTTKTYGDLKKALAKKYKDHTSLWHYTREKAVLVEECLKLAGFDEYIFNRAYSDDEYKDYQKIMSDLN